MTALFVMMKSDPPALRRREPWGVGEPGVRGRRHRAAPAATTPWCWCPNLHLPTLRRWLRAGHPARRPGRPSRSASTTVRPNELVHRWQESDISVPLKVVASPYREITRPVLDYVKRITKDSPRMVVTVFIPEYVVGHWWGGHPAQPELALRLKGPAAVRAQRHGDFRSVAVNSSERLKTLAPVGTGRCQTRNPGLTVADTDGGRMANGGSCVARDDGREWFVRATRAAGRAVRARSSINGDPIGTPCRGNPGTRVRAHRIAVPDRRRRRRAAATWRSRDPVARCAMIRVRWWPISCSAPAGSPGRAAAEPVGPAGQTGFGGPGASRSVPTAGPASTATTALNW